MVAGTAGAVRHHQQKRWDKQDAEQQQAYDDQPEEEYYDEPEEQQEAPPAEESLADKIQELAQLHEDGVLTDEEFAAAKQKLIES